VTMMQPPFAASHLLRGQTRAQEHTFFLIRREETPSSTQPGEKLLQNLLELPFFRESQTESAACPASPTPLPPTGPAAQTVPVQTQPRSSQGSTCSEQDHPWNPPASERIRGQPSQQASCRLRQSVVDAYRFSAQPLTSARSSEARVYFPSMKIQ